MRTLFGILTRNAITLLGTAVTTASAVVFATLFAIDIVRGSESPYAGILCYLIVPAVFLLGLLLIPAGIVLERRRSLRAGAGTERRFAVIDLNLDRTRKVVMGLALLTAVNIVILSTATYKGVEVLESTKFCGTTCHTIMEPEAVSHRRSAHARVRCVACHVGPGGAWFVRSKLSGTSQVLEAVLGRYPRPIPTPVGNRRSARDTCGQCHSTEKFSGDRLKVITHYTDDEATTPVKTVLWMHVGGSQAGIFKGIHRHADPAMRIRYLADTDLRVVSDVEVTLPDGKVRIYKAKDGEAASSGRGEPMTWRTMDCVDCHNRPAHALRTPEREVDRAIEDGRIDRNLPFVRRAAVRVLTAPYKDREEARRKIGEAVLTFYGTEHPEIAAARRAQIDQAGRVLAEIYDVNVFPEMKVTWGTHPDHLGHTDSPGCFRCHDDAHVSGEGKTISQDCALCHAISAMDEAQPAILKDLGQ